MNFESKTNKKPAPETNNPRRRVTDREPPSKERRDIFRDEVTKYKALIETIDTGYLILDEKGRVVDANPEYVHISGHHTLTEILGRSVVEWTAAYDKKRNSREVARCLKEGFVRNLEIDYVDREGRITPIEIQATVIKTGNSLQIVSLCRDITQRKKQEEALRLSEEVLSKAFQTSLEGITISTLAEGRYLDVNNAFLRITGHSREELIGRTSFDIKLWDDFNDRNKALAIIRKKRTLKNFAVKFKKKSGIKIDVLWSAELIEIKGQKCILSFCQDITRRKEAEEALRESEARYRTALEKSNDGICLSQKDILYEVNLKFLDIFGYDDPSEVVGKSIAQFIDTVDRPKVLAYALNRSRNKTLPTRYEFKGLRKNGEPIDIEISVTTITSNKEIFTLSVLRDITERKRAEATLKESEEKFRQLAETIREVFWLGSPDWNRIDYISPAYQVVWGLPAEKLYRHPRAWQDAIVNEDRSKVLGVIPTRLAPDATVIFPDYRIQRPDGSIRWISARAFPIVDGHGQVIRVAGIAEDITDRVQIEDDLKESRKHFQSLMDSATDFAVYRLVHDRDNPLKLRVVFYSPVITEIMGISDPMNFESWFETMHPDDVGRVITANQKAFETGRFNESYRFFHPIKKEWRWIQAISTGVLDEEKQTRYVNGILMDITDKKRAEEALQEAYETLEAKVRKRTSQLQIANERLKKEVRERKHIETDLRKSKDQLQLLSKRLINAQENERRRIANELHDELGQSLVGLKFQLSGFGKKLNQDQKELQFELKQASESIDAMTENVRRLSRDLRPSVLEHLGLIEALQWLFRDFAKKYEITVLKDVIIQNYPFTKEQELIVFRIFQEALTNIGKHSKATRVNITLAEKDKAAFFSIKDNGKGFNPKIAKERSPKKSGLGLTAMAERAQMAGGDLQIKSEPGKGTTLTFSIPFGKKHKPPSLKKQSK